MTKHFKKLTFGILLIFLFGSFSNFSIFAKDPQSLPIFSQPKLGIVNVNMKKYGRYIVATLEDSNFINSLGEEDKLEGCLSYLFLYSLSGGGHFCVLKIKNDIVDKMSTIIEKFSLVPLVSQPFLPDYDIKQDILEGSDNYKTPTHTFYYGDLFKAPNC